MKRPAIIFGLVFASVLAHCPACWAQRVIQEQAYHVAFSPCGKIFASSSAYHVKFWSIRGELIGTIKHDSNAQIAFSPNGKTLAAGGFHDIRLWDVETRKESAILKGEQKGNKYIAFSPDGATLASRSETGIKLWHIADMKAIEVAKTTGKDRRAGIAFSADGKYLAWNEPKEIILWDVKLRKRASTPIPAEAYGPPVFSPVGSMLAWREKKKITLWDTKTQKVIGQLDIAANDRFDSDPRPEVVFSPDGKRLVAVGYILGSDHKYWGPGIIVFDVESGLVIRSLFGEVRSMAFSPNGEILVTGTTNTIVQHYLGPVR